MRGAGRTRRSYSAPLPHPLPSPATGRIGRRRMLGLALVAGLSAGGLLPSAEQAGRDWLATLPSGPPTFEEVQATAAAYLAAAQTLTLGERTWAIARHELGLALAVEWREASSDQLPDGFSWWTPGLVATIDPARLEDALAGLAGPRRAAVPAQLSWVGGVVTLTPDTVGHRPDLAELAATLVERAGGLVEAALPVPLVLEPAAITAADLTPAADWLRQALGQPLTLADETASVTIPPARLAETVRMDATGAVVPDPAAWTAVLTALAADLAVPAEEPRLTIGPEQVVVVPPRPGKTLDVAATARASWRALQAGQTRAPLVFSSAPARQSPADLAAARALAERLLSRPPVLVAGQAERPLTAVEVAQLLRPDGAALTVDDPAAHDLLLALAPEMTVPPRLPFYRWRAGRAVAEGAGQAGQQLDALAAAEVLKRGLTRGETRLLLPMRVAPVPAPPADLAFPDLLAEGRTFFADSARDRYHNVALGLERINGALVAPGALFSFNQASGPVTQATGFRLGYGIEYVGGRVTTVPSVGGGICQVATTVFHAAFRAGLPMVDRSWHLYWMPRYGRPPSGMTGLDATVDDQSNLDFTFRNATDAWLLVEATVESGEAVVRLRGVAPGWRVTIAGPSISHVVRASSMVIERPDPKLPWGARVKIENAEDGKQVAIHRRVTDRHGQVVDDQVFVSTYAPAANVVLVGTGGRTA